MKRFIQCPVCNKQLKELGYHINRVHDIDVGQFKTLYPGHPLISEEQSIIKGLAISKQKRENPVRFSDERRAQISVTSKSSHQKRKEEDYTTYIKIQRDNAAKMRAKKGENFTHTQETKDKMRQSALVRPPRKPHTDETRARMRESAKNRPPRQKHSQQTKDAIKLGLAKFKESDRYSSYITEHTAKQKERYRTNPESFTKAVKSKQEKYTSSLEIKFQKFLDMNEIRFQHQFIIGRWTYDFFLPDMNMLVEIDGEYWHTKSLEQINKDKIKYHDAIKSGACLCRITDIAWQPDKIFWSKEFLNADSIEIVNSRQVAFILKESSKLQDKGPTG